MNARSSPEPRDDDRENAASQDDAANEPGADGATPHRKRSAPWSVDSAGEILRGIDEKRRTAIAAQFKARGGRFAAAFDRTSKSAMSEAIFEIENELEHAQINIAPSRRTLVNDLRARRNALLDAIGENERRT